jgi:tetratricopeptide (TPR) repeat protein
VLAGLLCFIHARQTSGSRQFAWLLALAAATLVGIFSKEGAIVVAAVVAVYELVAFDVAPPGSARRGRVRGDRWRFRVAAAAAVGGPLLLMAYARSVVLGASPAAEFPFVDNPIAGAGIARGAVTAVAVMGRYLWLLVWPARLSADYSYGQIPLASGTAADWLSWIAVAALAAIVGAAGWLTIRRRAPGAPAPLVFFFGAFAFVTFLPASNLFFPTGTAMAERLMYLPSVGLIALFVLAAGNLVRGLRIPAAAPIAMGIIVVLFAVRTWMRNPDWRDNLTLWTATIEAAPASFKAHRGLAEALYAADSRANLDRAIAEMEKSVAILAPLSDARNDARTHRQLASHYLEKGDAAAGDALQRRTALPPVSVDAYRKAIAMAQRTAAILDASMTEPHAAASADAQRLMSAASVRVGDYPPAIDAGRRARALEPSNIVGHRQLAAALLSAQRYEDAAVTLMTGVLLTNSPELRQQLMELYRQGLDPLACAVALTRDGAVLNPACPTVRRHLCAATADAIPLQIDTGHREDAERLKTSATELGCAAARR